MPANLENPAVGTELEKISVHSKEIGFHSERKAMPKNVQRESESRSLMSDSLRARGLYSHGILQASILEWVAFSFSRGPSQPRD